MNAAADLDWASDADLERAQPIAESLAALALAALFVADRRKRLDRAIAKLSKALDEVTAARDELHEALNLIADAERLHALRLDRAIPQMSICLPVRRGDNPRPTDFDVSDGGEA